MEITDIRLTKRNRYSVYIDGEFLCVLHPDVYAPSGFSVGDEISEEALEQLRCDSAYKFAREKALSLLSRQPYTAQKLYDKLFNFTEDEQCAEAAVLRMQELGLIDDADYAKRYAGECLNVKGFSIARTAQALRERGIDRALVEQTLESLEYDPQPAIARVVLRKYLRYLDDEKGVRKTIAALQRLGYRYGDIRAVLQNLADDAEYYDQE